MPQGACLAAGGVILIAMAISKKVKKEDSNKKEASENKAVSSGLTPHVTEKATFLGEKNAYVFKIEPEFNKIMVRQAVKKQYNVEPRKVRIINIPGKTVFIRRRQAQKAGYKKAIVYLKKGDTITA
mgnify:CR=1 FL=1